MDHKPAVFYHYLLPLDGHQLEAIPALIQGKGAAVCRSHTAAV